jgi:hypothetical protein
MKHWPPLLILATGLVAGCCVGEILAPSPKAPIASRAIFQDHRQVLRVCPGGVLLVHDGAALSVIRPGTLTGWDVAPGATADTICK